MLCVDRYGISTLPCDKLKMKFLNSINESLVYFKVYTYTHYIEQVERMIVEEKQYIL